MKSTATITSGMSSTVVDDQKDDVASTGGGVGIATLSERVVGVRNCQIVRNITMRITHKTSVRFVLAFFGAGAATTSGSGRKGSDIARKPRSCATGARAKYPTRFSERTKANRPPPYGESLSSHGRFLATPVGIEGRENSERSAEKTTDRVEDPIPAETIPELSSASDPKPAGDPDEALKGAIKAALEAGLYDRAKTLLDVLPKTSAAAAVVDLRDRRRE